MSLPTGYGKSLCYALLPSVFDLKYELKNKISIVMIVSLLVASRKDQASAFTEKGISAGYISDKESTDKKCEGTFCMGSTSWFSSVLKRYSWPLNGEECCVKITIKGILLALLQTRYIVSKNG